MNYAWMKLYVEIVDDPKMGKMSDSLFRYTILLFLIACNNGGSGELPDLEGLAWLLRLDKTTTAEIIEALIASGILEKVDDKLIVKNYVKRQSPLSANERQDRHRNGMSRKRENFVNASDIESDIESDIDIDIEKEKEQEKDTHRTRTVSVG